MYSDDTKKKLQDIISGTYINRQADHCTAARNFLCTGFSPNTTVKKDFDRQSAIKKEQAGILTDFISANHLWLNAPSPENRFLTHSGEAEIYFNQQNGYVTK